VLDVVAMQEMVVGAAGEGAAAVAQDEGAPNGGWNRARAPANGHVGSSLVVADGHDAAITGHTTKRFRGKRCSIVQGAKCRVGGATVVQTAFSAAYRC
jgi:hypothetical protein